MNDDDKPDNKWYPEKFDWYLKWSATVLMLVSMVSRAGGIEYRPYDLGFGSIGLALWLWVSIIWNDRALIILNTLSLVLVASTFLREL